MEKVTLPDARACEPNEEARQPLGGEEIATMHVDETKKSKRQNITFAESAKDQVCSQSSSTYKEALSQPLSSISHRQKLLWLQKRRGPGLWVQCDDCQRWRWLADVLDSHELPARWYCKNNPDSKMADCTIPEAPLRVRDEEDLIHAEYSCGSLVWAQLAGWPWWPAMVDDCPDVEQYYWLDGFSDIPTYYNVVFFDASETMRAWIAPNELKPFEGNVSNVVINGKHKKRLQAAMKLANDAYRLSPEARLQKYSFIARYKGPIVTPRKINKNVLKQYQKKLERKYQLPFPIESSDDDSEGDSGIQEEPIKKKVVKRRNVIIVGTPKSKKPMIEGPETPRNVILVGTPKGRNNSDTSGSPKVTSTLETHAMKPRRKLREIIEDNIMKLQDSDTNTFGGRAVAESTETTTLMESTKVTENINLLQNASEIESIDTVKEPNSMAAQCGSNKTPTLIGVSPQKEYLTTLTPMEDQETQRLTEPSTLLDHSEYRDSLTPSPSSDDFEF